MTAIESHTARHKPNPFEDFVRPLRGFHSQYLESHGFVRAKEEIAKMNRQYAITETIEILLETAGYQIPPGLKFPGAEQYESPVVSRLEEGRLFFAALALVYRGQPQHRKDKQFDAIDIHLFNTFNLHMSPHNALHLLDAANERDIEYMEGRLRSNRLAKFHDNPRLLSNDDVYTLKLDIAAREQKRANIRARARAL